MNAVIKKDTNPYFIRDFPRNSKHLHSLLEKYPISICQVDFGILSKLKFQIFDLYSQNNLADGEKDTEEYEFHLFKFEKLYPADLKRYQNEPEYRRFMDTNFEREQFN